MVGAVNKLRDIFDMTLSRTKGTFTLHKKAVYAALKRDLCTAIQIPTSAAPC